MNLLFALNEALDMLAEKGLPRCLPVTSTVPRQPGWPPQPWGLELQCADPAACALRVLSFTGTLTGVEMGLRAGAVPNREGEPGQQQIFWRRRTDRDGSTLTVIDADLPARLLGWTAQRQFPKRFGCIEDALAL